MTIFNKKEWFNIIKFSGVQCLIIATILLAIKEYAANIPWKIIILAPILTSVSIIPAVFLCRFIAYVLKEILEVISDR